MNKFQSHQIARIILRVRYGIATSEEKQMFDDWMKRGEERQMLYEKIVSDESLKEYLDLKADFNRTADYEKLHSGISRSLDKRKRQSQIKRYLLWWGSAAAVVFLACILVFKYVEFPVDNIKERPYVTEVASGPTVQDKVVLVLADGKRVGMSKFLRDSTRVGTAVVIGQEDKLVYDSELKQGDSVLLNKPEINKIITTTGGFYSLVLSDGTRVWLNSESELEFPVAFDEGERVVKLTGEAFFEVTKDAARPFIVETSEIRTRVLGTSFNIKAYKNESDIFATLFTGKVEVFSPMDTLQKVVLLPGKQADWDLGTKRLRVREVNLNHVIAWKEGSFMFDKENLETVIRQIERWYGVKFIYELGDKPEEYTFNGYFSRDESLDAILKAFTFMGGPEFKIEGDIVYVKKNR